MLAAPSSWRSTETSIGPIILASFLFAYPQRYCDCRQPLPDLAVLVAAAIICAERGGRIARRLAVDACTNARQRPPARLRNLLAAALTVNFAWPRGKARACEAHRIADAVVDLILNGPVRSPAARHDLVPSLARSLICHHVSGTAQHSHAFPSHLRKSATGHRSGQWFRLHLPPQSRGRRKRRSGVRHVGLPARLPKLAQPPRR